MPKKSIAAEKRKLEIALYEDAVVAKKCRQFADDDSYSVNELEIRANNTDNWYLSIINENIKMFYKIL